MGSPLGLLLANKLLTKLGGKLRKTVDSLHLCNRHLDDIICVAGKEHNVPHVLEEFECAHKSLDFKLEVETKSKLTFHDVLMIRQTPGHR